MWTIRDSQLTTRERFGIRRRHARKLLFSSLNFSQSSRMYTVVGLSDDSEHASVEESSSEVHNSVDILFSTHAESYVYSKFFNTGSIRVKSLKAIFSKTAQWIFAKVYNSWEVYARYLPRKFQ